MLSQESLFSAWSMGSGGPSTTGQTTELSHLEVRRWLFLSPYVLLHWPDPSVCLAGRGLGVSTQTPPGKMAPVSQGHFFGEGHSSNYAAGGQYPHTKRSWARHQYHPYTGLPRLCRLFQKPTSHLSSLAKVST